MSVHDEGYGDNVRPTLEFEFDFANRFRSVDAEGDKSWASDAHAAHRSEDSLMTSGPDRPGQPIPGQRSIFGTGRGPVFAQMPAYKPVTRGSEPQPQAPEPAQPDFGAYARQGVEPGVSGYANHNGASSYQTPSAQPRSYTTPDFPIPSRPSRPINPSRRPISPSRRRITSRSKVSRSPNSPTRAATSRSRPARATSRRLKPSRTQFRPSRRTSPSLRTPSRMPASRTGSSRPKPRSTLVMPSSDTTTRIMRTRAMATHPSKMRASPTPLSRTQVSPRRRPSRITLKRPLITTPLACMIPCIVTMRPLPTAPNPIRSCSPINPDTIIRPGTIISRPPRIPRRRAARVLCRRIRPCKPSMPYTISRRRSR